MHIFQPDLCFKKILSTFESKYLKQTHPEDRINFIRDSTYKLRKMFFSDEKNYLFTDFTNCYDEYEKTIFFDKAHVTDFGYKILCQKLCDLIIDNQII